MFLDSGSATATTRIIFLDFSSSTLLVEVMRPNYPWVAEISSESIKIHDFNYPEWFGRMISSVELGKSSNMMPGGAIGATEFRNKLGMSVVMTVQLPVAIGGI